MKSKCTVHVPKTKALITAKLIRVFVFAYADCWFCHEEAHIFLSSGCSAIIRSDMGSCTEFYLSIFHTAAPCEAALSVLR